MNDIDLDADELLLDAVDAVVLTALKPIRDDPDGRFRFFRRLLAVTTVAERSIALANKMRGNVDPERPPTLAPDRPRSRRKRGPGTRAGSCRLDALRKDATPARRGPT